ncbi:MAG: DUF1559 domain-containing protein, partial [Planctomycetales bacterium]|nr:DUF1559 domain-containing protein [Planctomycetales bacterium]
TTAYIQQKGDGTTRTLMLSENLHTVHWAYEQSNMYTSSGPQDEKWHFGFCWEQPASTDVQNGNLRINGALDEDSYQSVSDMQGTNDAFPSSRHPGGVNVAFVGGSVKFLNESISPLVYCQLMTSNAKVSDLKDPSGSVYEKELPPLSDADF